MRLKCSECNESVYGTDLMSILKEHIPTCDITPDRLVGCHLVTVAQYQELIELGL